MLVPTRPLAQTIWPSAQRDSLRRSQMKERRSDAFKISLLVAISARRHPYITVTGDCMLKSMLNMASYDLYNIQSTRVSEFCF